jgi:hypothetical protein
MDSPVPSGRGFRWALKLSESKAWMTKRPHVRVEFVTRNFSGEQKRLKFCRLSS